jgi:hypothetical protein
MIIARLCLPGGIRLFHGSVEIEGSPAGDDYRQGGWFPVDSFNFGFNSAKEEDKKKDGQQPAPNAPGARGSTGQTGGSAHSQHSANTAAKDKGALQEISIQKEIDRATTDLMALAMEEHSKPKGDNRAAAGGKELEADIHVLSSVVFGTGKQRYIFASLMIHLAHVRVEEWGINGSGDNRPSETVKLGFDKAAMHYSWYDGQAFIHFGPKGWSQKKPPGPWEGAEVLAAFDKYKAMVK